jgi:tRNA threonylcarbamoyl adenosine modification protein YeaZ
MSIVLAIDTATTEAVVAISAVEPWAVRDRVAADRWRAGYRHGEELLARIERLLVEHGHTPADIGGIVVGTGPGAFTGLRVGLATAKGLAHALGTPIAGVSTAEALLAAATTAGPSASADEPLVLLLPAGPADTVLCRPGETPRLVPGGADSGLRQDEALVALDLEGRVPEAALARGEAARARLAASLLALGCPRLADGGDDLARLEPEYVTLPRGIRSTVPDEAVRLTGRAP